MLHSIQPDSRSIGFNGVENCGYAKNLIFRVSVAQSACGASDALREGPGYCACQGRSPFHVFCQGLGAGVIALAASKGEGPLPDDLGTGQRSATVAQTSIRGLVTA